jgi:hypothetical protein
MTATTIERMPEIVQIRRCEDFAFKNYVFPETESSEDLLTKANSKGVSASYNLTAEIPNFGQVNIPYKHSISDSFHGAESAILPETYSVNDFLKENAIVFPKLQEDEEEIEEAFLRGIQPINHQHKVLFTQRVEIKTSDLKRRRPTIVLNPILFEDDE